MRIVKSFVVGCGLVISQLAVLSNAGMCASACDNRGFDSPYVYVNGVSGQKVDYSSKLGSAENKAGKSKVVVVKETKGKSNKSSVLGKLLKFAVAGSLVYFIVGKERISKAWSWFHDDFCGGSVDIATASSLMYIINSLTNVVRIFK